MSVPRNISRIADASSALRLLVAATLLLGLIAPFLAPATASAAITRVGAATTANNGTSGNARAQLAVNKPAGTAAGDVLIAQIVVAKDLQAANTICPPAGWVSIARNDFSFKVVQHTFYYVVPASDVAPSYTWTVRTTSDCVSGPLRTSNNGISGGIIRYTGVNTTTPLDAVTTVSTGSGTAPSAPAITTATDGAVVIRFFAAFKSLTVQTASSVTPIYSIGSTNNSAERTAGAYDAVKATAGNAGTFSGSFSTSADWAAQTVALKAAPTDVVAPTTTASATANSMAYTSNTWTPHDVSVSLSATDNAGGSGVKEVVYSASGAQTIASTTVPGAAAVVPTITAEGTTTITYFARDNAGNTESPAKTFVVKIDKTIPSIDAARTPDANSHGWNNSDVTVTFACADGLSGIQTCSAAQTFGEGANQTANGMAFDVAGNSNSASVTGINVDKTAPALSGAPTASPNADGWYNAAVTIVWTCDDALSGIDGPCPADSTIAGEGVGQSASTSVSEKAGNATTATSSPAVKIDTTAPVTTATAPANWNNVDVTVSLNAFDNLSGVKSTHYRLDGGATETGTSVTISADGIHTLEYWSVDYAGNVEAANSVVVKIDQTDPAITHEQSPPANGNGWNNTDVTLTFTCIDGGSGIASCTDPVTVTTEGQDQLVTGTAVDNAGNEATDPATVSIDKGAPTIGATPDRPANGNGWYKDDVTVTFSCDDSLSGIGDCPAPQTRGHGADQSVSGTATDAAGNSATATADDLDIDKVAPTLGGAPTTAPNSAGWYNADVTVAWSCGDDLSGIDGTCPADSTITGEGMGLTATESVSDEAGNVTAATSAPAVNIDRTVPSTTAAGVSDWATSAVTVGLTATDNLSTVAATYYTLDGGATETGTSVTVSAEGVHTLAFWSVDNAGNVEDANTVTVKIDATAPTISHDLEPAANASGWNNSAVTASFECSDPDLADGSAGSGVASCPGPITFVGEGTHVMTVEATDVASNSGTYTVTVKIDLTAPTIVGSRSPAANVHGWNNTDVTVSFACQDDGSGIIDCGPEQTVTNEGADQSRTGTAIDTADNSATATVTGISIDKTPPSLSGAATTPPNGAGWYNADVVVAWICGDPLSSIDGACPVDSIVSGEGDDLSAGATVSDKAGNQTSSSVTGIQIDRTAPTTTAMAPSSWVNDASVTVELHAEDNLSDVAATYYAVDGGAPVAGTSVSFTDEGVYTVSYWSVDNAGNVEAANVVQVKIDRSLPTIEHTQDPAANAGGWNNSDVTVTFICADEVGGSGIASCTAPLTVTTEGLNQPVSGTAIDNAGNSQSHTAQVSIDFTAPAITGSRTPEPNPAGWNNTDVRVSFECSDALSGIAVGGCPAQTTLSNDGAGQSVLGTATDNAGNTANATVEGINIDKTAPSIVANATTEDGAYASDSWTNKTVTVSFTCDDALSGLTAACPEPIVVSDSTAAGGQNVSAQINDIAGNTGTSNVIIVKVDKQAPEFTSTPSNQTVEATSASGATVSWDDPTANDALSGLGTGTCVPPSESTFALGLTSVICTATDTVGNVASTSFIVTVVDTTAPVISGLPSNTTVEAATATGTVVSWTAPTADDLVDGSVAVTCAPPSGTKFPFGTTTVGCSTTDAAGNPASASFTVTVKPKPYAIFALKSNSCDTQAIEISGGSSSMVGNLHSNSGMKLSGSKHTVTGGTTYRCSFERSGSGNTFASAAAQDTDVWPDPIGKAASSFACTYSKVGSFDLASDGPWWVNGKKSSNQLKPGVYCATGASGLIKLSGSGISGNVTLVAARVEISGSKFNLSAYSDGILAYATGSGSAALKISGSGGKWQGHLYAPQGQIEMSGSGGVVLNGGIVGWTVKLSGSNWAITAQ